MVSLLDAPYCPTLGWLACLCIIAFSWQLESVGAVDDRIFVCSSDAGPSSCFRDVVNNDPIVPFATVPLLHIHGAPNNEGLTTFACTGVLVNTMTSSIQAVCGVTILTAEHCVTEGLISLSLQFPGSGRSVTLTPPYIIVRRTLEDYAMICLAPDSPAAQQLNFIPADRYEQIKLTSPGRVAGQNGRTIGYTDDPPTSQLKGLYTSPAQIAAASVDTGPDDLTIYGTFTRKNSGSPVYGSNNELIGITYACYRGARDPPPLFSRCSIRVLTPGLISKLRTLLLTGDTMNIERSRTCTIC
jgi:hypothetical protein